MTAVASAPADGPRLRGAVIAPMGIDAHKKTCPRCGEPRTSGLRVRMRRLMLNLSQEKLGKALGLTFQQVQNEPNGLKPIAASG